MGDREQEWRNGKYLMRGDARRHLDRGGSGGAHPQESGVCEGALKSRRGHIAEGSTLKLTHVTGKKADTPSNHYVT